MGTAVRGSAVTAVVAIKLIVPSLSQVFQVAERYRLFVLFSPSRRVPFKS